MKNEVKAVGYPTIILAFLVLGCVQLPALGAGSDFQLLQELSVGDSSGWRVLTVDESTHQLYAVTASNVYVVDLNQGQVVKQFTNIVDVHAFAVVSKEHQAFYLQGQEPKLKIVNLNTFKKMSEVKTGSQPGPMLIEPVGISYVFNTGDNTVTAFEADDGDLMGNTPLPGTPRSAALDPRSHRIFIAIEDKGMVAVMNPARRNEITSWPIAPGEKPAGIALESPFARLLVGCNNGKLMMLDSNNGKVIDTADVNAGADTVLYDTALKEIFVSGDKGTISIVHLDSPQKLALGQTLNPPSGVECMALDAKAHKLYVGSTDSKIRVYGPGKP